jgi:hypothetical protein
MHERIANAMEAAAENLNFPGIYYMVTICNEKYLNPRRLWRVYYVPLTDAKYTHILRNVRSSTAMACLYLTTNLKV